MLSKMLIILFWKVFKPDFSKMRQVTAHDAGTNLCPELDLGLCLAPDNGTEMRLVDADDAVGTSADVLLEHHFLLFIHLERCLKTLVVMTAEASKKCA